MSVWYVANGTCYRLSNDELYHYGVKGMKWGHRKQRAVTLANPKRTVSPEEQAKKKAERKAKAKRAAKVGAAVVGTALAAYGGYKLAKYVQGKRQQSAMKKASAYINNNLFDKIGDSTFRDGTRQMTFRNGMGTEITTRGSRGNVGKAIGQHNAKTIATGRQMYRDATNTRLDKGLARVVNAGDAVEKTTKRAASSVGNAAKNTARKTKNSVLDVINPIYEYTPSAPRTTSWVDSDGMKWTKTATDYYKTKRKRQ